MYFPNGTYIIDYMHFGGDIKICGESKESTIIKRNVGFNANKTHPKYANIIGNCDSQFEREVKVIIENITIDGSGDTAIYGDTMSYMYNNIQIYNANYLFVSNVLFKNSIGDGLYVGGTNFTLIQNCDFYNCGLTPLKNTTRNGLTLAKNYYNRQTSSHVIKDNDLIAEVRGCTFDTCLDMGILEHGLYSTRIHDCTFTNIHTTDLELYSSIRAYAANYNQILDIVSCSFEKGLTFSTLGNEQEDGTTFINIDKNFFVKPTGRKDIDIMLNQLNGRQINLKVTNNVCISTGRFIKTFENVNCVIENNNIDCDVCISCQGTSDMILANKNIMNATTQCFYFYNTNSKVKLCNNIIKSSASAIYMLNQNDTLVADYEFVGNNITGTNGIYSSSVTSSEIVKIIDNTFDCATINYTQLIQKPVYLYARGNILKNSDKFNANGTNVYVDNFKATT